MTKRKRKKNPKGRRRRRKAEKIVTIRTAADLKKLMLGRPGDADDLLSGYEVSRGRKPPK